MEDQKPLLSDISPSQSNQHHDPTTAGHAGGRLSETESFFRFLETTARELMPPPWALRCLHQRSRRVRDKGERTSPSFSDEERRDYLGTQLLCGCERARGPVIDELSHPGDERDVPPSWVVLLVAPGPPPRTDFFAKEMMQHSAARKPTLFIPPVPLCLLAILAPQYPSQIAPPFTSLPCHIRWDDALERIEGLDELFYPENRAERPIIATAGPSSIHSAGENFLRYWSPVFVEDAEKVDMAECSMLCAAGDGLTCGGDERIQVYTTASDAAPSKRSTGESVRVPFFYHGCYAREAGARALGLSHSHTSAALGMTVEYCAKFCLETQGQPLFGLEDGDLCRCGAVIDMGVIPGPAGACDVSCPGDAPQSCGAPGRLSLYSASANPPPLAYRRLGCARRGQDGAVLADADESTAWQGGEMTVRACAGWCAAAFPGQERLVRFALEEGSVCSCAVGGHLDFASPALCNMPCAGNDREHCGGKGVASVYGMSI
ncbi:WSC domain-containing protein [Colletotrichum sojae]|uniref:WSC domain-containing protein n=1 Tax=Colletotrichum sojae TaxID=2175907 RepID=A0A8H6MK70_9PEZI|nr:WSC domain-containing protein [Colletotrichum sojae]